MLLASGHGTSLNALTLVVPLLFGRGIDVEEAATCTRRPSLVAKRSKGLYAERPHPSPHIPQRVRGWRPVAIRTSRGQVRPDRDSSSGSGVPTDCQRTSELSQCGYTSQVFANRAWIPEEY